MDDVIDLGYLIKVLKKHVLFIIIIGILCGGIAFSVADFVLPKKYKSTALLYVENNQQTSDSVNINDITASQKLVNTCQVLFESNSMLDQLITNLKLPYTKPALDEMITTSSVNSTEIMQIVVETSDPYESEKIVNELVRLAEIEFNRVIKSGSIEVIDYGQVNIKPSSPNVLQITFIGILGGIALACAIVVFRDFLDTVVKHEDSLSAIYNIPVFAEVSDYEGPKNGKYGYSKYHYGNKYGYGTSGTDYNFVYENATKDNEEGSNADVGPQHMRTKKMSEKFLNKDTSFAIAEAYNTARTNIMFSIASKQNKIVAVTSCNPSEGKSTTCANLAISFANAGNRTLLVECDLRKPTMVKNFGLKNTLNGLSGVLCDFCSIEDATYGEVVRNLDVMPAGRIPPNPSELLGSEAMEEFLKISAEKYDYVFLDTPPVNVVTDSQLTNNVIAGIVFVVRENSTSHPDIQEALEKINLANGRTLGFVKTFCRFEVKSGRGKKYGAYYKYGYSDRTSKKTDSDKKEKVAE